MSSAVRNTLLVGGAVLILLAVLLAPKLPATKRKALSGVPDKAVSVDEQVQQAVQLVQSGQSPMKGIMALQKVVKNDSTNVDAQWYLGKFSIQSGQLQKALGRFEKVIRFDRDHKYPTALLMLGRTYVALGDTSRGIDALERYGQTETDTSVSRQLQQLIQTLQNN